MADFNLAIGRTLLNEDPTLGGAVTMDEGSPNRWGIRQADFPSVDVPNLSLQAAIGIYQAEFWDKLGLSRLNDQPVASKVFDMAVNDGPGGDSEILQAAVEEMRPGSNLGGPGIGPLTIAAANACDWPLLLSAIRRCAASHYRSLVDRNPALAKYLNNWLWRAAQ